MPAATRTTTIGGRRSSPRRTVLASLGLCLALATPVSAAGPKAIGTMTLVDEPGLAGIAIVGYQWAARSTSAAGGSGNTVGKIVFDAFGVTKLLDATSPALLDLTFAGRHVKEVRIDVPLRRGTIASYVLSEVIVTAGERRSADNGGRPLETLSGQATRIRETVVSPGGTVTTCWSVETNEICD